MNRVFAALCLTPSVVAAQNVVTDRIDQTVARRVAERVATSVEQSYVFPDTGRLIAEHIRGRIRSGAYDEVLGAGQLADRLGIDLKKTNGDLHLYVNFVGNRSANPADGPRVIMRRPGEQPPPAELLQVRRANHFIRSAERRAGNVGYLSIAQLSARADEAFAVVDAAMSFLDRTDAMIIDLRSTPGGDVRMSDYVASYFFGPEPVPTLNSYTRSVDRTMERATVQVNGRKRPDVPLFVLVGLGTASGAEDLAFTLKQTKRATLVGERTAGAGRLTRPYPIGDGFEVSVPGGRTFDPRTGAEWERVGVQPDIVTTDDALVVAHAEALKRMAAAATDSSLATVLSWARDALLARARPHRVSATTLASYAGTYDTRVISLENGKLWYQRAANRAKEELTPIDDRTFALGEASRIEFLKEGTRITGVRLYMTPSIISQFPRTAQSTGN